MAALNKFFSLLPMGVGMDSEGVRPGKEEHDYRSDIIIAAWEPLPELLFHGHT